MILQFFLPMIPPNVTHHAKKLAAYVDGKTGKPKAVLHDTEELRDVHAKLHGALAPHAPDTAMPGPVRLIVKWIFPADDKHRPEEWKTSKPDTDNLEKALKDEMTKLRFWKDDAQVCSEVTEKFYGEYPGIWIRTEEL